jgi:hypothetical protein
MLRPVGVQTNAILGILGGCLIAGIAIARRQPAVEVPAAESTTVLRIVRRNAMGLPEKKSTVRDPAHVRTLTEALGIDLHREGPCPEDYAEADIGIVLAGNDVYVRRNVYVFGMFAEAGAPAVVSVTSAGCRVGPPADLATLRSELRSAKVLE